MKNSISVLVRNERQYEIVKKYSVSTIYSDNVELLLKHPEIYLEMPITYDSEKIEFDRLLVSDMGLVYKYKNEKKMISSYPLNVANLKFIELLESYGVEKICLSLECSLEELRFFKNLDNYPVEVLVYGRVIDMTLKTHPLINSDSYQLEDEKKRRYKIKLDKYHHVNLYHHEPINRLKEISDLLGLGIHSFRVDFFDEDLSEIDNILHLMCQELKI